MQAAKFDDTYPDARMCDDAFMANGKIIAAICKHTHINTKTLAPDVAIMQAVGGNCLAGMAG